MTNAWLVGFLTFIPRVITHNIAMWLTRRSKVDWDCSKTLTLLGISESQNRFWEESCVFSFGALSDCAYRPYCLTGLVFISALSSALMFAVWSPLYGCLERSRRTHALVSLRTSSQDSESDMLPVLTVPHCPSTRRLRTGAHVARELTKHVANGGLRRRVQLRELVSPVNRGKHGDSLC